MLIHTSIQVQNFMKAHDCDTYSTRSCAASISDSFSNFHIYCTVRLDVLSLHVLLQLPLSLV